MQVLQYNQQLRTTTGDKLESGGMEAFSTLPTYPASEIRVLVCVHVHFQIAGLLVGKVVHLRPHQHRLLVVRPC